MRPLVKRALLRASSLLLAASAVAGSVAVAMHVRMTRTPLAHSAEGATLYELREDGPEGGGSITYRVQGKLPSDTVDFLVSSNFSPGNGSRPQTVSSESCRQRLTALGAELARRKIAGVTAHPEGCGAKARTGLVTAKP